MRVFLFLILAALIAACNGELPLTNMETVVSTSRLPSNLTDNVDLPKNSTYVLVLFEKATGVAIDSLTNVVLKAEHSAHLAKAGKLLDRGVFEDADGWEVLCLLAVPTIAEAQALLQSNPAIEQGVLVAEYKTCKRNW